MSQSVRYCSHNFLISNDILASCSNKHTNYEVKMNDEAFKSAHNLVFKEKKRAPFRHKVTYKYLSCIHHLQ